MFPPPPEISVRFLTNTTVYLCTRTADKQHAITATTRRGVTHGRRRGGIMKTDGRGFAITSSLLLFTVCSVTVVQPFAPIAVPFYR